MEGGSSGSSERQQGRTCRCAFMTRLPFPHDPFLPIFAKHNPTCSEYLEDNVWSTMALSVLCAWVILVIVTRNWWISTMVAVMIVAIMACVIATVFTIGYILDIFVSTFVALTIGLAIDYSVVRTPRSVAGPCSSRG